MKILGWVLALGALNWGLSVFNLDLVAMLMGGSGTLLAKAVYLAIGAAGAYKVYILVSKKK